MSRGGQPDKHPQLLVAKTNDQTAVDTDTDTIVPLPVPRFATQTRQGVWCFEILKLWVHVKNVVTLAAVNSYSVTIATAPGIAEGWDPRSIIFHSYNIVPGAAGPYITPPDPHEYAYEDSGGRGLLIGTDNLYVHFHTTGTASALNYATVRFLYRLRRVSATEYIGIVQSQQ